MDGVVFFCDELKDGFLGAFFHFCDLVPHSLLLYQGFFLLPDYFPLIFLLFLLFVLVVFYFVFGSLLLTISPIVPLYPLF